MSEKYIINPLLNDSLNNLVKRLDRSKVPKPSLAKGQSLKKKSKIYSSVPNIFYNCSENIDSNEKTNVQWTNKYNIDVESIRNAFKRNYDILFIDQKKRSSSIPLLSREIEDNIEKQSDKNAEPDTLNKENGSVINSEDTKSEAHASIENNSETFEVSVKNDSEMSQSGFDKHTINDLNQNEKPDIEETTDNKISEQMKREDYLDGAIIEPISPPSSNKETIKEVVTEENENESEKLNEKEEIDESNLKNVKLKRGRKKKIIKKKGRPPLNKTEKLFEEIKQIDETKILTEETPIDQVEKPKEIIDKTKEIEAEKVEEIKVIDECIEESTDKLIDRVLEEVSKSLSHNVEKKLIKVTTETEESNKKREQKQENLEQPQKLDKQKRPVINLEKPKGKKRGRKPKNKETIIENISVTNNENIEIIELNMEMPDIQEKEKYTEPEEINEKLPNKTEDINESKSEIKAVGNEKKVEIIEEKIIKPKESIIIAEENPITEEKVLPEVKPSELEEKVITPEENTTVSEESTKIIITKETEKVETEEKESVEKPILELEPEVLKPLSPITPEKPKSPIKEQTNDLEMLTNSLSNSVDTSMLPPRKRYKRFMYLETNNKGQFSPKTTPVANITELNNTPNTILQAAQEKPIEAKEFENKDSDTKHDEDTNKPKPETIPSTTSKTISRIKTNISNKKKKISPLKLKATSTISNTTRTSRKTSSTEIETTQNIIESTPIITEVSETAKSTNSEENIKSSPSSSSSLKRSKREAAARGFANMVAMSINNNNSNQIQDNLSEASSKRTGGAASIKPEIESCSSSIINAAESNTSETSKVTIQKTKKDNESKEKLTTKRNSKLLIDNKLKEPNQVPVTKKSKSSNKKEKINIFDTEPSSPIDQTNVKYRKIRTNAYLDCKPTMWYEENEKCACKPSKLKHLYDKSTNNTKQNNKHKDKKSSIIKASNELRLSWDCTENCLNRLIYTECNSKTCPCSESCQNQKIRKNEWINNLKLMNITGKGKGVITTEPIKEGSFIIEYVGEVVSEKTFHERLINKYNNDGHHYCLHLDGDMLIDAYRCGSLARFINHNCSPNCEMQKWLVNGVPHMCIFATEDIPANTELSYDYNFCSYNNENAQKCLCGSNNCRGYIGSKPLAIKTESQKDRQKLHYIFGKRLNPREKLFAKRRSIFLLRNRELGRCRRLGIKNVRLTRGGNKLPSVISEIKRRKDKKNQFLTQMSALNSIRSIRTRQLQNAQDNELLTHIAQLGQVLRDLYNSLLQLTDPDNPKQQLLISFIKPLNHKRYPEFYRTIQMQGAGNDNNKSNGPITCFNQICKKLEDGRYETMLEFDKDVLTILYNIEMYAGRQSSIGKCVEKIKAAYKDLKINSIALYEVLTDQVFDEKDKAKLTSNNLYQVCLASAVLKGTNDSSSNLSDNRKRKSESVTTTQSSTALAEAGVGNFPRNRLERGAEVIKCVCGFLVEANHIMVQCDQCFVWQHAACMNVARGTKDVGCDVTRQEPYYCHICLNIPNNLLEREIPRSYIISNTEETDEDGKKLFWTLWADLEQKTLVKIDDFVLVKYEKDDLFAVMRIYSLWKDEKGDRWMEGGLFLRPYDSRLGTQTSTTIPATKTNSKSRRSSSQPNERPTQVFHKQELIYTEFSETLELNSKRLHPLRLVHVLNPHTYKQGRPIESDSSSVFICDWMVSEDKLEWTELDPNYLKINTKSYCFNKFDKEFERDDTLLEKVYSTDDLLNLDRGIMSDIELLEKKGLSPRNSINGSEKREQQLKFMEKLINKLHEFARDRNQKLPPSSSPSSASGSSSCGSSPTHEVVGSEIDQITSRSRRKQPNPIKKVPGKPQEIQHTTTVQSPSNDQSPQLMIVTEDQQPVQHAETRSNDDNISQKTDDDGSTPKANTVTTTTNTEEYSNLGSEINFGELADILKDKPQPTPSVQTTKQTSSKLAVGRPKRSQVSTNTTPTPPSKKSKRQTKKVINAIQTSENIRAPSDRRLRTRNATKRIITDLSDEDEVLEESLEVSEETKKLPPKKVKKQDKIPTEEENTNKDLESQSVTSKKSTEKEIIEEKIEENIDIVEKSKEKQEETACQEKDLDDENDDTKSCFVKLERLKVKNKASPSPNVTDTNVSKSNQETTDTNQVNTTIPDNNTMNNQSSINSNRSKRKKGVPKRIPIENTTNTPTKATINPDDIPLQSIIAAEESVKTAMNLSIKETVESTKVFIQPKTPEKIITSHTSQQPSQKQTVKTNDFSSIENISSD